ncbi:MAG: apolipoprotein N-acyltransferase [Bacteroidota bacterium]
MNFKTLRIPLLGILGIIFSVCAYQMTQLPLWGHRPLVLFGSFWAFFVLLVAPKFSKLPQNYRLLGLATLSGLLLGFGFPVSPLTPLMFIGFIPLLMIEKEIAEERTDTNKKDVLKYVYHAFVIWNIISTYWVSNSASFVAGIIAIWLNAAFMSVPFLLFHQTRKIMPRDFMYLAFIVNWLTWEYFDLRWEVSWPWLTLGNSFAQYPSWVQWYEYTGVFGGSLWILLVNLLIFRWLIVPKYYEKSAIGKINPIKLALLISMPIGFSLGLYSGYTEKGTPVEIVVVQPNFEPHYQKFTVPKNVQLDRFLELSKSKLTQNTEYLVFPETSFGSFDRDNLNRSEIIQKLRQLIDDYPKLKLITGISAFKRYAKNEPLGNAMRRQVNQRTGEVINWEAYNAAIQLESGNTDIQFYKKAKFVPGAEIFPYPSFFFFAEPIVDKLGGTLAGYGYQEKRTPFSSQTGNVGAAICYESVYGEYYTGYVKEGANAIFIVTNDGWWDNTPGYKQHLKFASLRAIETRRPIARSANTGITAFINQRGDIEQPTNYEEATAINGTILFNDAPTIYVTWGDLIGRVAIFAFLLLLLNTFVKGILKK